MSDKLLAVLSTRQKMRVENFKQACGALQLLENIKDDNFSVLRRIGLIMRIFDSLGHCEYDYSEREIAICPPALALLPIYGLPQAVLVGARTPDLLKKLNSVVRSQQQDLEFSVGSQRIENMDLPTVRTITGANIDALKRLASEVGLLFDSAVPTAWKLATVSGGVREKEKSLLFERRIEPNWPKRIFDTNRLMFLKDGASSEGQHLCSFKDPASQQLRHWIIEGDKGVDVDRNWGRYFILSKMDIDVLRYDKNSFKFCVPVTVALPCLLARALTLCSGFAPKQVNMLRNDAAVEYNVYSNVPPAIADMVGHKLAQRINEINILELL